MQDVDRLSQPEKDQLLLAASALTDEDRLAFFAEEWETLHDVE